MDRVDRATGHRRGGVGIDTPNSPLDLVASGQDLTRLWYADPTGEAAIRHILAADDFSVVDHTGATVFRISGQALAAALHLYTFTPSRRGRSVRAHVRKE